MQPKLLAFLAAFTLLAACNCKEQPNSPHPSSPCPGDDTMFQKYKESLTMSEVITPAEAWSLADEYVKYITPKDPNATRAVWIDRKVILAFADAFKKDQTLDGIRFYFGRYGEHHQYADRRNKLTMFLLATRDSVGYHRDTFLFKKEEEKATVEMFNFNHGELCPCECNGSYFEGICK